MEQEAIYNNKVKEGLTSTEVERSRAEHGENVLTPPKRTSFWRLYLEKYEDPIIRILLVAAVISLGLAVFSGEYVETIGIILAVLFATTVGFYFERDAAKKFDVLTALGEDSCSQQEARKPIGRQGSTCSRLVGRLWRRFGLYLSVLSACCPCGAARATVCHFIRKLQIILRWTVLMA